MKQSSIDRDLRARIDAFLAELSGIVRSAALAAVESALGGASSAPRSASAAAPVTASAKVKRGRRGKRTSEQVAADSQRVLAYIKSHPAQRLEQIGAGLGRPTKGLKLPIQKLIADKLISTTGQRRGMKYSAGGAKARGRAKKA